MELYTPYGTQRTKKGARKRIYYNKVDNTGTFTALHLADMLVKHGQANPYMDTHGGKMTRYRFSLALGKALFLYTRKVFASKWAREDFPCNSKHSLHGLIREPHRTINRMNNNNNRYKYIL